MKIHRQKNAFFSYLAMASLLLIKSETTDVAAQHPDLIRQFDTIVEREHTPSHINDWEIVNPKLTNGGM